VKRTELARKTPLRQKVPLRSKSPERSSAPLRPSKPPSRTLSRRRQPRPLEPGEMAWKERQSGRCENCGVSALRLERHHVIELKHCKAEGLPLYDLENSILLCPRCHSRHTSATERLSRRKLSAVALAFGEQRLGVERFGLYLARYYGP
jgi:5-methylcytosine-specific restriction endonuclease McrA